jgi:HEAT repeat protein
VVEPLLTALKDENSEVRLAAARALGEIGDPQAVEPLLAALKDQHSSVRRAAAEALGRISDVRAVESLPAALKNALKDEDRDVRRAAAKALAQQIKGVEYLMSALTDRPWMAREAAAEMLGEIKDPRAVEPLRAVLKDEEGSVRRAAVKALVQIKGMEHLIAGIDFELSVAVLQYGDAEKQQAAARALGRSQDPRAVEPLLAALKDYDYYSLKDYGYYSQAVRQAAAEALGTLGDQKAVQPLTALLTDRRSNEEAAHALVALG